MGHARREGITEGIVEGIAIGEAKGEVKGKSSMIKRLIQKGHTISEIADFYDTTENEIEKILSQG
ncbi:MAG: hypothetical protein IJ192_14650 [Clostridia bacterium]|nr:hypothetical protein [Clostridia bacterium]